MAADQPPAKDNKWVVQRYSRGRRCSMTPSSTSGSGSWSPTGTTAIWFYKESYLRFSNAALLPGQTGQVGGGQPALALFRGRVPPAPECQAGLMCLVGHRVLAGAREVLQPPLQGGFMAPCPSKPGPCIPKGHVCSPGNPKSTVCHVLGGTGWHGATLCGGCHCPSAGEAEGPTVLLRLPSWATLRVHPASCIVSYGSGRAPAEPSGKGRVQMKTADRMHVFYSLL